MKYTITSIGVIDREKQLHRDFAIQALEHLVDREYVLIYELYKEEQFELIEIVQDKIRQLFKEINYLMKYNKHDAHTERVV